jgi:hypothetical protein
MKRGQIKIPASILEKAGITPNAGIVVWLNNNSGRWIDIKVLEATDKGLNDRKNVLLKAGQYLDRLDGLKYKDFLDKSNLLIPASYRKQNGIISATGAICNVWFDDKRQCIVVETPETMCDFSHDQVRSIPAAPVNVPVCAECAPEVKPGGKADRLLAIFESINDKLEALGA